MSELTYKIADAIIKNFNGDIIFHKPDLEVPSHWSQQAINILAQKYLRKTNVPNETVPVKEKNVPEQLLPNKPAKNATFGGETSFRQVFQRLAFSWTYWGWKEGLFETVDDALKFANQIIEDLYFQRAAPNSPQWFNTGLNWAYGIKGDPRGNWRVDPETGIAVECTDTYTNPQVHACFLNSVEDSINGEYGIMDLWVREARIFTGGSGSGANYSKIRGINEPISHGGTSSGLMSFLKTGDASAGAIKSGGTTRRAAKMVVLDIDHPEIEDFMDWKTKEENKVAALVSGSHTNHRSIQEILASAEKNPDIENNQEFIHAVARAKNAFVPQGLISRAIQLIKNGIYQLDYKTFSTDWQDESYLSVSGQNANNTVSISDAFMNALKDDSFFNLTWRTNGSISKTLKAKDLWDKLCFNTWASADPGVHYSSIINDWHTIPEAGPIRTSNPCSEYMSIDDSGCNLASINLGAFYNDEHRSFEIAKYMETIRAWSKVLEISVYMAQYPSKLIAENAYKYRQLGLGYANLGALLMRMGFAYDSDEGRTVAAVLTSSLTANGYLESAHMAEKVGPFHNYERNTRAIEVVNNHAVAAGVRTTDISSYNNIGVKPIELDDEVISRLPVWVKNLQIEANDAWIMAYNHGKHHGFRNSQISAIAPTGTISLVMDCDTTGIEPEFALIKYKSLAGGGTMKMVNAAIKPALTNLGYNENEIPQIMAYIDQHSTIDGCEILKAEHLSVFDCAIPTAIDGSFIAWEGHVKMLGATQPFVSGSTSKTINMPSTASIDDIAKAYLLAYDLGVKAVAIYRDGSKLSQPLTIDKSITEKAEALVGNSLKSQGISEEEKSSRLREFILRVADKAVKANSRKSLPNFRSGHTQKIEIDGYKIYLRTGEYEDGRLGEIFIDMNKEGATFRSLMNIFAISVSIGLQYGVPLEEFVDAFTFTKFEPSGIVRGHNQIKMAQSIADLIFRHLAIHYLDRQDLANVKLPSSPTEISDKKEKTAAAPKEETSIEKPYVAPKLTTKISGYTGSICSNCNSVRMRRTGTCEICEDCGQSSGGCG
jgi:ribonucleoside-diphosphate reductase alpha chain